MVLSEQIPNPSISGIQWLSKQLPLSFQIIMLGSLSSFSDLDRQSATFFFFPLWTKLRIVFGLSVCSENSSAHIDVSKQETRKGGWRWRFGRSPGSPARWGTSGSNGWQPPGPKALSHSIHWLLWKWVTGAVDPVPGRALRAAHSTLTGQVGTCSGGGPSRPERGRCQCRIGRTPSPIHALTDSDDSDKDEDYTLPPSLHHSHLSRAPHDDSQVAQVMLERTPHFLSLQVRQPHPLQGSQSPSLSFIARWLGCNLSSSRCRESGKIGLRPSDTVQGGTRNRMP